MWEAESWTWQTMVKYYVLICKHVCIAWLDMYTSFYKHIVKDTHFLGPLSYILLLFLIINLLYCSWERDDKCYKGLPPL